jgi:hypothetical protein
MVLVRDNGRSWLHLAGTDQSDVGDLIYGLSQLALPGAFDRVIAKIPDRSHSFQLAATARDAAQALTKMADQLLGRSPGSMTTSLPGMKAKGSRTPPKPVAAVEKPKLKLKLKLKRERIRIIRR